MKSLGTTSVNRLAKPLLFALAMLLEPAAAQSGSRLLNISGILYNATGTAILDNSVQFKLEIRDKDGLCVLYSETHTADLS
ncbi:MAG: hypothetical protein KF799_15765, partial [Bdellovibrionales bacterium]|nr:hypothetical protein [Bdellovibrionales bacterium]